MRTSALVIALGLAILFGIAFGDAASDRRNLISQIDSKLEAAANKLSGLERKSDARDVDDAQAYVREIQRLVDDLKKVKENDSSADRIISYYPDYVRAFGDASNELKKLKDRQGKADELVRQCEAFDKQMKASAEATKDEPRAAEELAELAKVIGGKGEDWMKAAGTQWAEVQRHRDDVRRFSASEGRWSRVRDNLHGSAEAIVSVWRDSHDKAKRACEEVVKRERHRDVERVLAVLSNSRAGRADLRKRIDELLANLSDKIKDAQGQTGTGYVNDAVRITTELESLLERLGRVVGDDRDAKQVASTWPAWVRALRDSLNALKELKHNQHRADGGAAKCEAAEQALDRTIQRFIDERGKLPEPDKDLALEADLLGTPIKSGIVAAQEVDRKMADWASKAKAFGQSDGPWTRLTSNLRDTADRAHAHWRGQLGAMVQACDKVALGKAHPKVKSAIDQLRGKTGSEADKAEAEVNAWVVRAQATYKLDCDAMREMWHAYCSIDFEPGEDPSEVARQTAASLQDRMQRAMRPVIQELPALQRQVAALTGKNQTRSRGESLAAKLARERGRLERLWMSDRWHGSNDPVRQFALKYGRDQHASLWSRFSCQVPTAGDKDALFPGSEKHRKPDCINAKSCQIWEFKPDSPQGRDDGRRQIADYEKVVPRYYNERHRQKQPAEGKLGGTDIMNTLVANCLRGGEIKFDVGIHLYKMCEAQYECTRGD